MSIAVPLQLPDALSDLGRYEWLSIDLGRSGAQVYRLESPGRPTLFVKYAVTQAPAAATLRGEAERLGWLQGKLPVPSVRHFYADEARVLLVTTGLPGRDLTHFNAVDDALKRRLTVLLGESLRAFHALSAEGCPFDHTVKVQLARLETQLQKLEAAGKDAETGAVRAARLKLDELQVEQPLAEDMVLTHGDPCLPNVLIVGEGERLRLSGFIDLGDAGLGDRYRDLALAHWSLGYNFGAGYGDLLFESYGLEPDPAKLEFYLRLEQFVVGVGDEGSA